MKVFTVYDINDEQYCTDDNGNMLAFSRIKFAESWVNKYNRWRADNGLEEHGFRVETAEFEETK